MPSAHVVASPASNSCEMRETRDQIANVVRTAQREAAATGVPVERVLAEMPEARSLFQGRGMAGMAEVEAAGGLSDEMAGAVVRIHDEITGQAVRLGTETTIDDFARLTGMQPERVLVGNSRARWLGGGDSTTEVGFDPDWPRCVRVISVRSSPTRGDQRRRCGCVRHVERLDGWPGDT